MFIPIFYGYQKINPPLSYQCYIYIIDNRHYITPNSEQQYTIIIIII